MRTILIGYLALFSLSASAAAEPARTSHGRDVSDPSDQTTSVDPPTRLAPRLRNATPRVTNCAFHLNAGDALSYSFPFAAGQDVVVSADLLADQSVGADIDMAVSDPQQTLVAQSLDHGMGGTPGYSDVAHWTAEIDGRFEIRLQNNGSGQAVGYVNVTPAQFGLENCRPVKLTLSPS